MGAFQQMQREPGPRAPGLPEGVSAGRKHDSAFDRRAIPDAAHEGHWIAPDGSFIRRIDWAPLAGKRVRGSLLFLPGRGDFYEKYLETLDHWHRLGWRVTALDWRGQAGSGRNSDSPTTGHVEDFGLWIEDLAAFWAEWKVETADVPGPKVLVAHSMGGHLALRALAEKRIDPVAMALSAPMLGFATPGPVPLLHLVARAMCRFGNPARPAWKWSEKPGESVSRRATLLTHDPARYADEMFWRETRPDLAMGPGSWRWVERGYASMRSLFARGVLESVETPVLLLSARHDKLVDSRAIERAAKRLPRAQLVTWDEAYHELLREEDAVRNEALRRIDDFFDRLAPVQTAPHA
jgi:lysophospholipase